MISRAASQDARCPECGAPLLGGISRGERLGLLLAWEVEDPALQADHFLTVACNDLQHPARFTDVALAGLRAVFVAYLDKGLTVAEIRRVGRTAAGTARVLRQASERQSASRAWSMTIADVALPDQPGGAATRVRAWAARIRAEA